MKNWLFWMAAGLIAIIGGAWALLHPAAAETVAGWALLVVGALQGWTAYGASGFRATGSRAVGAVVALLLGAMLLFGPFEDGTVTVTVIGLLLLGAGGAKLWIAQSVKGDRFMPVILAAGAASVVLGALTLMGWITSMGLLLGLELLAIGAALLVLSLRRKDAATAR